MIDEKIIDDLREYLKNHYVPSVLEESECLEFNRPYMTRTSVGREPASFESACNEPAGVKKHSVFYNISEDAEDYIKKNRKPGGFAHALEKKRKEKALTPAELYKKANIDRRQYSRLMGPEGRHPSMNTAISFALALRLDRQEFDELLQTAGYALSNTSNRDVCIMYCLEKSIYDINDVNTLLFTIGIASLTRE